MMELSKDVNTHIILTFAGTKHFITSEQNEKLKEVGEKDFFEVGGAMLKMSTVSAIMPVEDYYRAKPEERPTQSLQEFKVPREEYAPLDRQMERSKGRMEGLVRGLREYCATPASGPGSKAMLAKAEGRYKELYPSYQVPTPPPKRTEDESLPVQEQF